MKLIGKGAFTKAYKLDNGDVLLKSCDPIKECMAFGWFPDSPRFPEVNWTNTQGEYTMDYFPYSAGLKNKLDPIEWELYQTLRGLDHYEPNKYNYYNTWYKKFEALPDRFAEAREALLDALSACSNYGSDVQFEISPRNVRVVEGKLVFMDCFFIISKLDEVRGL